MAYRFRQPLLLTGNIFVLIFIVSLQGRLSFAELAGSSMVAGAVVVLISVLGPFRSWPGSSLHWDRNQWGLGPYFWSLAFGVLASVVVEPAGLKEFRVSERGVRA